MEKKINFKNDKLIEGVLILALSIFFIKESFKLHSNKSWALSPALFPLIITIALVFLSSLLIVRSLDEKIVDRGQVNRERFMKLGLIIIISFLYVIILPKVHFLIGSMIYLMLFLFILGERNWYLLATISIITPIWIQYFFGNLLNVFLP